MLFSFFVCFLHKLSHLLSANHVSDGETSTGVGICLQSSSDRRDCDFRRGLGGTHSYHFHTGTTVPHHHNSALHFSFLSRRSKCAGCAGWWGFSSPFLPGRHQNKSHIYRWLNFLLCLASSLPTKAEPRELDAVFWIKLGFSTIQNL